MRSALDEVKKTNIRLTNRIQELEDSINRLTLHNPDYTDELNDNTVNMANENTGYQNSER